MPTYAAALHGGDLGCHPKDATPSSSISTSAESGEDSKTHSGHTNNVDVFVSRADSKMKSVVNLVAHSSGTAFEFLLDAVPFVTAVMRRAVGAADGAADGATVGATDGAADGTADGATDGATDGTADGATDGATDGAAVGPMDIASGDSFEEAVPVDSLVCVLIAAKDPVDFSCMV